MDGKQPKSPTTSQALDKYKELRRAAAFANTKGDSLVIKCKCGSEIRRIPILNTELTFDELCFMIHRLFRSRLSSNMDLMVLQYKDDEGDWVQLTDDLDISHAATLSSTITIQVFDKEKLPPPDFQDDTPNRSVGNAKDLREIVKELETVKETVTNLLWKLSTIETSTVVSTSQGDEPKTQDNVTKESGGSKIALEANSVKPLSTADMAELLENSTGDRKKSVAKDPVPGNVSVQNPPVKQAETAKPPPVQHPSPAPTDPQQSPAPYQHPQPGAPVASPVIPNFYPHAPSLPPQHQQQHYGHYAHHGPHNPPFYSPGHYPSSLQQLPAGFPQMLSGPSNLSLQQQQQNQYQTNEQKRSSN